MLPAYIFNAQYEIIKAVLHWKTVEVMITKICDTISHVEFSWGLIQYKDVLPVYEIPLWR